MLHNWLIGLGRSKSRRSGVGDARTKARQRRRSWSFRPVVEALEERTLLAITINTYLPDLTTQRAVFERSDADYAKATGLSSTKGYEFQVLDKAGIQKGLSGCRTGATSFSDHYDITATDPLSSSANWSYRILEFSSKTCTGTGTVKGTAPFSVAGVETFADAALTTPKSSFKPGEPVFLRVLGFAQSQGDVSVTWVKPNLTSACANTSGADRPDSDASGTLPTGAGKFLQIPTSATGDAWNQSGKYDSTSGCAALTASGEGLWQLQMVKSLTLTVQLDAFTLDATAPAAPTGLGTSPKSPANNNNPLVTGTAEAGSTVRIYTGSTCSSTMAGTGTAAGGSFSISVSVGDNTTTTFNATAQDAAGNTSPCSTSSVTYVEASNPPFCLPTGLESIVTGKPDYRPEETVT